MKRVTLRDYMRRAGIRSKRELCERTGIPPRTMDRIFDNPRQGRGHQLDSIFEACAMSAEEARNLIRREE